MVDYSVNNRTVRSICVSKGLPMVHLNIRSLLPKVSENVPFFSCSETWLDSEIDIANYSLTRRDRNNKGGSVCAYIRSVLMLKERKDLDNAAVEAVWLEMFIPKSKYILLGICYGTPDWNDFSERLEESLIGSKYNIGQETIILGDLNTDMNKKDSTY